MAPLHEVCVVYSGVGCGLRSFGPYHPLPPPPPPSCCWTPTPSVEWTRWSSRWHQRASRRPRKGRPTTLPPSLHSHHPSCHHARPPTPALPAQDGCGEHRPPSHIHTTTHLIYPIAPGGGPGLSLAPPLTVWPANTGLHPHKPMQSTSLTMPFPDPPRRRKMAERPPTDSAGRGYWRRCE